MSRWRGEVEAILSSLCFGLAPIFAKKGLLGGVHPFYGAAIANSTALVIMILFVLLRTPIKTIERTKQSGLFYVFLGGLCNSIALLSFFWAMSIGKVALVVPISCIYPLFTMVAAFFFLREIERINRFTVIGTLLIVVGIVLTVQI